MKNPGAIPPGFPQTPKIENPEFFRLIESSGIIDRDFIKELLEEFDNNAIDVLATLIQSGIGSKHKLSQLWCDSIGIAHVDLEKTLFQPEVVAKIPERIARHYYAIPVYRLGDTITIATATPDNKEIQKILENVTGEPVNLVFALPQDIEEAIEKEYRNGNGNAIFEFFNKLSASKLLKSQQPITTRLLAESGGEEALNQLPVAVILYAVTKSANEIMISTGSDQSRIDFAVPYGKKIYFTIEKDVYDRLVTRLKSMAGMDRPDTSGARHGRITIPTPGKKIDVKFESRPEDKGAPVILKLTATRPLRKTFSLKSLYLSHVILQKIAKDIQRPGGHILIAGPAKSGKSTLAYAILNARANYFKKNISIENAIKSLLPGIDQYQVNREAGSTAMQLFESGLGQRSETVYMQNIEEPGIPEKTTEAALAGHYIISGINSGDALDALEKMIRLGGASTAGLILCQQLVARLCDNCKVKYRLKPDHIKMIFETNGETDVYAWQGHGCPYCNDSGFSGQIGIHELLVIDKPIRKMIIDRTPPAEIRTAIKPENLYTMHYDGIKKVLRGLTTFDEIGRLPFS